MSAPMKVVAEHFGFTPEHVVAAVKKSYGLCGKLNEKGAVSCNLV